MRDWLGEQRDEMVRLVRRWAEINSGTTNVAGVQRMAEAAREAFAPLADEVVERTLAPRQVVNARGEVVEEPVGPAVVFTRRAEAPLRVLLSAHLDTVFAADSPFQRVREVDAATLNGPGVADIKGGMVVMLFALRALERLSPRRVGWTVVLNPDEEVGSPSSLPLLRELAGRHHFGLVYEPALPDGSLAGARKGAGGYTVVIRGRAAHVGRDFAAGRSAMHAAAELVSALVRLNGDDVTINCGKIDGGGPANVVADLAVVRLNVRAAGAAAQARIERALAEQVAAIDGRDGYSAALHGGFASPPKPLTGRTLELFRHVRTCGAALGIPIAWRDTGGVCDGNKLAAAGLPNVDSLGVRGGGLHSHDEFMSIGSLVERARLSALLLERLERGEIAW